MILQKAFYLVSSGFIGGLGMLLLTSGRVFEMDSTLITATIVFIAWQTLGVTVSKLGSDQIVFATSVGNPHLIDMRPVIKRKVVPIAAAFALFSIFKYPVLTILVLFISIVLDAASILLQAKLNAELEVKKVFTASLLNYPAFLLMLYVVTLAGNVGLQSVAVCFLLSSLLRCTYLTLASKIWNVRAYHAAIPLKGSIVLGAYQGINYWIFKGGQVMAGLSVFSGWSNDIAVFFFFWTAIDLIDRFHLAVVPLIYRQLADGGPRFNATLIAALSLFLSTAFLIFVWVSRTWLHIRVDSTYAIGLWLNVLLLFVPNYLVFKAVRQGHYLTLVRAGFAACALSSAFFAALYIHGSGMLALVMYVPCQLLFLCIFIAALEGSKRTAHESAVTNTV